MEDSGCSKKGDVDDFVPTDSNAIDFFLEESGADTLGAVTKSVLTQNDESEEDSEEEEEGNNSLVAKFNEDIDLDDDGSPEPSGGKVVKRIDEAYEQL